MNKNKFDKFFHEDMSTIEAQTMFFRLYDQCDENEVEALKDAFLRVSDEIVQNEFDYSQKTGFVR